MYFGPHGPGTENLTSLIGHMLIIGISGKLGSGKDYICDHVLKPLLARSGICCVAFADPIRLTVASRLGLSIEELARSRKSPAVRKAMQLAGTEEGRMVYGEDIWIRYLDNYLKLRQARGDYISTVIITDCRFPNEVKWIEDMGGFVLRVEAADRNMDALSAEGFTGGPQHISETALDKYAFTYVIDNTIGAEGHVRQQVSEAVSRYISAHLDKSVYFPSLGLPTLVPLRDRAQRLIGNPECGQATDMGTS